MPGLRLTREGILNRWGLAAALDSRLPQVRGRDRLLRRIRGSTAPQRLREEVAISWGPGLKTTLNPSLDGSLQALYAAQWVRPALIPILEACLVPGDLFVDVGANVGLYATWGAKIVGPTGSVVAFEPVPQTRTWLKKICVENQLDHVDILACAAGADEGKASMHTVEGASGLSRLVAGTTGTLDVEITTLDHVLVDREPSLIKIDVEGHELSVLKGASETLKRTRVPVVFETPESGGGSGTFDCIRMLERVGYRMFALTPKGVRHLEGFGPSHNLLGVHLNDHATLKRLSTARFPRAQNT